MRACIEKIKRLLRARGTDRIAWSGRRSGFVHSAWSNCPERGPLGVVQLQLATLEGRVCFVRIPLSGN